MSQGSSLIKNTLIIAIGKLSTQFLTFLLLPLYTAFLSPDSFGQLDLITVYLALLAPTLTVQMEMAVFRYLIDARGGSIQQVRGVLSSSLAVTALGAAIGVLGIVGLGLVIDLPLTPYIAGAFLAMISLNFLLQVTRGMGRNDLFAIASIITGLLNITLSVVALVVLRMSLEGILGALIIANVIGSIFLVLATRIAKHIRVKFIERSIIKELLLYSWPLVPNNIAIWGINGISRTIVAIVLGLTATGIYAAASKFTLIYTSLYSIFAMSWTESVSLHLGKKGRFLSNASNSTVKLFGSLALLIISASAILFPLLVSSSFNEAKQYIPLLIIGGFFASIMTHYGAIYIAAKETTKIAKVTLQAVTISTVLTLAGIWVIGLWAPAIALIITYIYIAVRRHYDIQRLVKITYATSTYVQLGLLAVFVILLYYINNQVLNTFSIVVTLSAVAFVNKEDLRKIKSTITRKGAN